MKATYRITLVSDAESWINAYIPELARVFRRDGHRVRRIHRMQALTRGDFAFLLGCSQIVPPQLLALHTHNLVVHESAVPKGRGWSPLTWQVLNGARTVPITLFEAAERVDTGVIYLQDKMRFNGTELVDELRALQADKTLQLCRAFVRRYPGVVKRARTQRGTPSYFPRRGPADSRLELNKTLASQLNLLRVVDNDRYPAYFVFKGHKYLVKIYRDDSPGA